MKAFLALASTLLFGADAQCNASVCMHNTTATGRPEYKAPCFNLNATTCIDCPADQYWDIFDSRFNASAPACVPAAGANPQCIDRFAGKDLPYPQWFGLLDPQVEPQFAPFFQLEDVPTFVALVYGFYTNAFPTAPAVGEGALSTAVNKDTDVYVTFYDQSSNCTNDAFCDEVYNNATAAGQSILPHLDGSEFPVSQCVKLIYNNVPVALVFNIKDNGKCGFGLFQGHTCNYEGTLALSNEPTVEAESGTCVDFPAQQGFKLTVSCMNAGSPKSFKPANDAVLDRVLHDSTCRSVGRIIFPCATPVFCSDQLTPTDETFVNATIACEDQILNKSNDCAAAITCLQNQPGINGSAFNNECLSTLCGDDDGETSASSLITASAVLASLLALF